MRNLKTPLLMIAALTALAGRLCAEKSAPDEVQLDQKWNALSPREKAAALRLHQAFRQLPGDERKFINERIERFLQMSPEERRRLKENNERWKRMPPAERQQAREKYEQRRKEFEEKWRREHPGEEPPPFPFHKQGKRNLATPSSSDSEGVAPKNKQTTPKESKP